MGGRELPRALPLFEPPPPCAHLRHRAHRPELDLQRAAAGHADRPARDRLPLRRRRRLHHARAAVEPLAAPRVAAGDGERAVGLGDEGGRARLHRDGDGGRGADVLDVRAHERLDRQLAAARGERRRRERVRAERHEVVLARAERVEVRVALARAGRHRALGHVGGAGAGGLRRGMGEEAEEEREGRPSHSHSCWVCGRCSAARNTSEV